MNNNLKISSHIERSALFFLCLIEIMIISCSGQNKNPLKSGSDSFNFKISKAERFTLQKNDSCTVLTIKNPWQGAEGFEQVFYLVKKGTEFSYNFDSSKVIFVPIHDIICTSTTHLAMISALGEEEAVTGISGAKYIYNKSIAQRINEGLVHDIGYDAGLNSELILKMKPDLLIMYGVGGEALSYTDKIKELGIKVLFDADYLETDPLGKAEWIKLFGALFCKENKADSIFKSVAEEYNKIKDYINLNTSKKPFVLLGLPFKDTWFVSPGNSYISRLIDDAGGNYLWKDKESSWSMPFSLENVYLQSLKAEFWLNIGSVNSKNEIASFDPRLETIPSFKNGNLFNNNKRMSAEGGNDYWESGSVNPQVILKDIASILHPDLFKNYEPVYYRKIE